MYKASCKYLAQPYEVDRFVNDMVPSSEIFVPIQIGDAVELAPNPKLAKAFTNNILPAIAMELIENDRTVDELEPDDIRKGVERARKAHLFQLDIGEFRRHDEDDRLVTLRSIFSAVCPGSGMFLNALSKQLLAKYDAVLRQKN